MRKYWRIFIEEFGNDKKLFNVGLSIILKAYHYWLFSHPQFEKNKQEREGNRIKCKNLIDKTKSIKKKWIIK